MSWSGKRSWGGGGSGGDKWQKTEKSGWGKGGRKGRRDKEEPPTKESLDAALDAYFGKTTPGADKKASSGDKETVNAAITKVGVRVRNPWSKRTGVVTEVEKDSKQFKVKFDDDSSEAWRPIENFEAMETSEGDKAGGKEGDKAGEKEGEKEKEKESVKSS